MSADCDKETACPTSEKQVKLDYETSGSEKACEGKRQKPPRNVSFPDDDHLVTQYFEPANPWQDVPPTNRAQLAADYLEYCRRHNTPPIECVLEQIRELPESSIGGCIRAPRLTISDCALVGCAPCDALEALLCKAQFRRLELRDVGLDDEAAEALFDMIEYYESANVLSIGGPRLFGIRGWQAASRMIKKSAELTELEVTAAAISAAHAPVLARALRAHSCSLLALSLASAELCGEPLLPPVIALKSNSSVRELRLGDNRLTPMDAQQLAHLLRINTHIQVLDLSNNQIQDAGVGHIADALEQQASTSANSSPQSPQQAPASSPESRGLAVLVLWNNQLTRNCAHHLARALRSSQSLTVLNIGRNAIGTETISSLTGSRLISLGLQGARLGADAGVKLAKLLTPPLQRLDLRDNKLGSMGLQPILAALKENKQTNTQIDLDDPIECPLDDPEIVAQSRLTLEIRALCTSNNRTATTIGRNHRKISLTCHTAPPVYVSPVCEEGRARLRSPAPSPAPSPVPPACRFSVTRVTPERESSSESLSPSTPTRPTRPTSPMQSRFTVRAVAEPPAIKVQSASEQTRKSTSRFSVTRNYDSVYNPTPVPSPPPDASTSPTPPPTIDESTIKQRLEKTQHQTSPDQHSTKTDQHKNEDKSTNEVLTPTPVQKVTRAPTPAIVIEADRDSPEPLAITQPKCQQTLNNEPGKEIGQTKPIDDKREIKETPVEEVHKDNTQIDDKRLSSVSECAENVNINNSVECVTKTVAEPVEVTASNQKDKQTESVNCKSDNKNCFSDKTEQLWHSEAVSDVSDAKKLKTETKLVKNSTEVRENEKIDVQVEVVVVKESVHNVNTQAAKVHSDQNNENVRIDNVNVSSEKTDVAMKQIEAITEDLGNLIQEMKDLTIKTQQVSNKKEVKIKTDCTQTEDSALDNFNNVPANVTRDNVVLKKNKSESSLDSPDLEVSRLMNKKLVTSPFCDSSSSLEISGSSMESLNALEQPQIIMKPFVIQESVESDTELDRRKPDHVGLSTESSIESNTSELTPVNNSNFLNMSLSSNESVSPIIFGKNKKLHGSLSSLEASVSSLESKQDRLMVTSADSGIEHSLQNPSENKEEASSNEGTLTMNSSLKEGKKPECYQVFQVQETLTSSPKRTSSLLDVPASKSKALERVRKISLVAPSPSFQLPKPEPEKGELKLTSLEKLLSIFQHPASLFSKSQSDEERKSASNTPPRKDSSLSSSFWSWGSSADKIEREDSPSEPTDSTLSERVQVSFVDESFSKKLDSKTPSTDTDNTLSEFQAFPAQASSDSSQTDDKRTLTETTDDELVQKCLELSSKCVDNASSHNVAQPGTCDKTDLMKPNDFNKNVYENPSGDNNKNAGQKDDTQTDKQDKATDTKAVETKTEPVKPRSFAAVLKSSGSENSLEKQTSPEGQPVDKLPSKVIRGIKENISPENTLTSSMSNTKALVCELSERQTKTHTVVNALWEVTLDKCELKHEDNKAQCDMAPIATIDETIDETADQLVHIPLEFIDDAGSDFEEKDSKNSMSLDGDINIDTKTLIDVELSTALENVDLGKDALSYLIFENQNFESTSQTDIQTMQGSLAEELKEAEIQEKLIDLSPELIIDDAAQVPEVFTSKDSKGKIIPERAKIKKSNSLEDLALSPLQSEKDSSRKIAFTMPETSMTTPKDIPETRPRIRTRSGSSPKSLPETLNKPSPLSRMESAKKKKKVSSLGKMAKDSLLALNMSEDEISEFRRSYITSVESLRSLESVSEDAYSQSGNSLDSRCRACLRTSQESLMSLDSINEDCRCAEDCNKPHSAR